MEDIDVLIIGAGAAGAAAAWSLARDGFKVTCFEQGDFMDPSEYPSTQTNWEELRQTLFNPSPNVRKLDADYPINDSNSPIAIANFNAVAKLININSSILSNPSLTSTNISFPLVPSAI